MLFSMNLVCGSVVLGRSFILLGIVRFKMICYLLLICFFGFLGRGLVVLVFGVCVW